MDRSDVKKMFPHSGGGLFCHKNQSCSKLPELDTSGVKKFPLILAGGGFSATKTKVARNCLKWIDLVSKKFPSSYGGGGLFCYKNQSCSKLPEMDRSGVKKISLILWGGGFSVTKTKVAQNCLKWIDLMSKNFPSSSGRGFFCHKNQSCLKLPEMDRSGVKKFSLKLKGGGLFCHKNQSCSKICLKWIDLVSKKFPSSWWGGFSATKTKVAWNCVKWIDLMFKKISPHPGWGLAFLPQKPKLLKIAWNG